MLSFRGTPRLGSIKYMLASRIKRDGLSVRRPAWSSGGPDSERGKLHGVRAISIADPEFVRAGTIRLKGNLCLVRRNTRRLLLSRGDDERLRMRTSIPQIHSPDIHVGDTFHVGKARCSRSNSHVKVRCVMAEWQSFSLARMIQRYFPQVSEIQRRCKNEASSIAGPPQPSDSVQPVKKPDRFAVTETRGVYREAAP